MIEVWTNIMDKEGNTSYRKIASYANNLFPQFRGWHKGADHKSDGLNTFMG